MNGERKETEEKEQAPADYFWVKMFALSLLILAVNLWSIHHSIDKFIGAILSNGPLALLGIYGFFSGLIDKDKKDSVATIAKKGLLFFLETPVLFALYGICLLFGSTLSSVTVLADGERETATVRLAPEGTGAADEKTKKRLKGPDSVVTFIAFTTPFGRPFYLEVDGYIRESFDLFPLVGKKIRVRQDLSVSPSVLIRVPTGLHSLLETGAIRIGIDGGKKEKLELKAGSASVMVGRRSSIPESFFQRWRMELAARNTPDSMAARSILRWSNASFSKKTLKQGMVLEAEFVDRNGKPHASADLSLSERKISDLLMAPLR